MKEKISSVFAFIKGTFSDDDGAPSFSRCASGLILVAGIGWVTHLVLHNHTLPDLGGLTLFITSPYGVNRLEAAFSKKSEAVPTEVKPQK